MSLQARLQDAAVTTGLAWSGTPVRVAGVTLVTVVLGLIALAAQAPPASRPGAASLLVEWPSGRRASESLPDVLDTPVLPGSVAKVFALAAAVDAGLVDEHTTHMCRRVALADGRRFACSHPDLKRPLSAAEALAYSCNDFFVQLATRLPRATLNEVRRKAGLASVSHEAPWASAVLGLAGPATAPRALLAAVARVAGVGPEPPVAMSDVARRIVRDGMRGSAEYGSAGAFGSRSIAALAKTGTAPMPGGRALGLVVAFAPPAAPSRAVLVVVPGGAGLDAASIAADMLATPRPPSTAAAILPSLSPAPSPPFTGATVTEEALRQASSGETIRIGRTPADGSVRIETLAIEEYVARVISGEGQPRAGSAAQEALAIVIRTFALANRHRHRAEGYDLCDTTHCQVMRPSIDIARRAALATAGRLLLDNGKPAFVYYSALCGGIPALASEVWPGATDHRPGAAVDDACEGEPPWTSDLRADQVEQALRAAGLRGQRLRDLRVVSRTTSQRADRVRADGFVPAEVSAHELRMAVGRTVGWQYMRSTSFTVARTSAGYRFRGVGYGHGVGLCVIGAGHRAARGESVAQILRAYFGELVMSGAGATTTLAAAPPPRTVLVPVPPIAPAAVEASDIRLALPAAEERDRAQLMGLLRRARAEIAQAAGVPEPSTLTMTVHPSVESFGRATGQPWWIAASTVGHEIDVLPVGVLRQRGILESTLRHEVAHVVVDGELTSRRVWVREGAAIYFANPTAPVLGESRVSCPADAELLQPVSAGTQREAYGRAERCFRRQLARKNDWREVR